MPAPPAIPPPPPSQPPMGMPSGGHVAGQPWQYPHHPGVLPYPPAPALREDSMDYSRSDKGGKRKMRNGKMSRSKRRESSSDDDDDRSSAHSRSTQSSRSSRTSSRYSDKKSKRRSSRYFGDDHDSGIGSSESDTYVDDRKPSRSKSRSKSTSRRDRDDRSSRRSIGSSSRSASTASSRGSSRYGSTRRGSTKMAVRRKSRSGRLGRDDSSSESSDESDDLSYSSRGSSGRKSLSSRGTSMSGRSSVSAYTFKDRSGRKKSRRRAGDSDSGSDGPASIATTRPGRSGRKTYKQNSGLVHAANRLAFEAGRKETHVSALAQIFANMASVPIELFDHKQTRRCSSRCLGCAMQALVNPRKMRDSRQAFGPFKSYAHDQEARDPAQLLKRVMQDLRKHGVQEVAYGYYFQTGCACVHGHGAVRSDRPNNFHPIKVSTRGVKTLEGALRKFAKGPVPKDWDLVQCQDRDCRSRSHKDRTSKSGSKPYYSPRIFNGPQKLVVVLDRYSKSDRKGGKDDSTIKCPPMLSIEPVVPKSKLRDGNDTDYEYELNAVICDKGRSPGSGPYVTFVKTSDDGWMKYDERGSPPKRVSAGYAHENRDAYMLFYEKAVSNPKTQTWHFKNTGNGLQFTGGNGMPPPPAAPFGNLFGFPF